MHGGFYPYPGYILENVHKIKHIPCTIIQGCYKTFLVKSIVIVLYYIFILFHVYEQYMVYKRLELTTTIIVLCFIYRLFTNNLHFRSMVEDIISIFHVFM